MSLIGDDRMPATELLTYLSDQLSIVLSISLSPNYGRYLHIHWVHSNVDKHGCLKRYEDEKVMLVENAEELETKVHPMVRNHGEGPY